MSVSLIHRDGAEVRVEDGVGKVITIDPPKGDRQNVKVTIRAPHLREAVSAWTEVGAEVLKRCQWALERDADVAYVVEVKRKRTIAADLPLKDLAGRDKVRELVSIERPENAPARPVDEAPPAAPAPAPAAPAPAARRGPSKEQADALGALAEARRTGASNAIVGALVRAAREICPDIEVQRVLDNNQRPLTRHHGPVPAEEDPWANEGADAPAAATEAPPAPVSDLASYRDPDGVAERSPAARPIAEPAGGEGRPPSAVSGLTRQRTAVASDGRPWDYFNTDGRINLSSYAAGAVLEMVELASRLMVTRGRQRHAEDPENHPLAAPSREGISDLAGALLHVVDSVQAKMRDGGRVDRMAASHKLARRAVREGLDLYPVPWGSDDEGVLAWKRDVAAHALVLCEVSLGILEPAAAEAEAKAAGS